MNAPGLGSGVALKLENLQHTGSFKVRGAARALEALDGPSRRRGVIVSSAGNHGAGVAWVAARLGVRATVVVPRGTPRVKRARIEAEGAEVAIAGDGYDAAEAEARRRAKDSGAAFVSPFDDDDVIEGNGARLARELLDQAPRLARVVCPVGGGGLAGGLARELAPRGVEVVGVQPARNCAMHESLALGRALTVYGGEPTVAEGCEGAVSARTYELARRHLTRIALVSEDAIGAAVAWLYRRAGQIAEATAAVAAAAVLGGEVEPAGPTAVIVTGGNIEPETLDALVRGGTRPVTLL